MTNPATSFTTGATRFVPAGGGRVIGAADEPEPALESHPRLRPATHLTVGVVDTGVVLDRRGWPHPWFGRDHLSYCREDDEDSLDHDAGAQDPSDGHGTFVAGVILREAPTARVRMWGVLDKDRVPARFDGPTKDDDAAAAAAIGALAINRNVQVINLSFDGGSWGERSEPKLLAGALREIHEHHTRIAVVASAGNESAGTEVWPAAFEHVISVGALDERAPVARGASPPIAQFSNTGDWIDAYAHGVKVLGPYSPVDGEPGWARWSGTSFAAATVSGRIAQLAIERGLSGAQAWQLLRSTAPTVGGYPGVWIRSVDSPPFTD